MLASMQQEVGSASVEAAVDGRFFAGLDRKVDFLFVRHGQSEGNARGIVQGRLDLPLDERGRTQARALGAWIAGRPPELILSSPLKRAHETAELIRASLPGLSLPPLRAEQLLSELDAGPFSGLGFEEIRTRDEGAYRAFLERSWDGVPGAEGSAELYARALRVWELLRAEALGGRAAILAVTHGGFLQWIIKATLGLRTWMPLMPMSNCGLSHFVVEPRAGACVLSWRRIDWLAPGLRTEAEPLF